MFVKLFIVVLLIIFQGCDANNSDHYGASSSQFSVRETIGNGRSVSCDIVLDKRYYTICYDYNFKGALFVSYLLSGERVNTTNIADRPPFYSDASIPKEYASKSSDYIGSGYDRGHLAPDASFDYSQDALKSVYVMSNIIPQYPSVNRYSWSDTEEEERKLATKYGEVEVIIGVVYDENPQRIGDDFIAVPSAFYKSIVSADGSEVCYYYDNIPIDDSIDSLKDHQVDCATLPLHYDGMPNYFNN